jgi:hypothetical protein
MKAMPTGLYESVVYVIAIALVTWVGRRLADRKGTMCDTKKVTWIWIMLQYHVKQYNTKAV